MIIRKIAETFKVLFNGNSKKDEESSRNEELDSLERAIEIRLADCKVSKGNLKVRRRANVGE